MFGNLFKRKNNAYNDSYGSNYPTAETDTFPNVEALETKRKRRAIAIISLLLVCIVAVSVFAFKYLYVKKGFETVESFVNLEAPNQQEATGEIKKELDGYNITFEIKANYVLYGKVVEKYYYFPSKIINKISRYDFGMVFGPLLEDNNADKIDFKNNGRRFLQYRYPNSLTQKLGKDNVINSISNNHLIHSDEIVLKKIRNVKEGDYIKIVGQLVNVYYEGNNQRGNWPTSLSRDDHGDGACEVFYVTDIIWLKLK